LVLALSALGLGGIASTDAQARQTRARDFTGVWRLDDGRQGWRDDAGDDRYEPGRDRGYRRGGNGWGTPVAHRLPPVMRIEKARRALRIEDSRGNLLRSVAAAHQWNGDRLEIESTGAGGRRIVETFSLERRGQRLVVQTKTRGPQGWREFTQVYERA